MKRGAPHAALAYLLWGAFPIYFRLLHEISPLEIMFSRIAWSLLFIVAVLAARRQWSWIADVLNKPRLLAGAGLSALLLSVNWLTYIWAVNQGRVVDASLGYFINPLVNILLGFLLLHERLRPGQWASIAVAATGVAWLTIQAGHPPWIGLILAATFGAYGLLRKTAPLGPLEGLALETGLLFPLAVSALAYMAAYGGLAFFKAKTETQFLMAASGPITAIPLLLFATGARRISLSMLGLLQYIAPSMQLLIGVWLYGEPFHGQRLFGFAVIWSALVLYWLEGFVRSRRPPA